MSWRDPAPITSRVSWIGRRWGCIPACANSIFSCSIYGELTAQQLWRAYLSVFLTSHHGHMVLPVRAGRLVWWWSIWHTVPSSHLGRLLKPKSSFVKPEILNLQHSLAKIYGTPRFEVQLELCFSFVSRGIIWAQQKKLVYYRWSCRQAAREPEISDYDTTPMTTCIPISYSATVFF